MTHASLIVVGERPVAEECPCRHSHWGQRRYWVITANVDGKYVLHKSVVLEA